MRKGTRGPVGYYKDFGLYFELRWGERGFLREGGILFVFLNIILCLFCLNKEGKSKKTSLECIAVIQQREIGVDWYSNVE